MKNCINWWEIKNFPKSLFTECPIQSWYVTLGTGLVLSSFSTWLGIWSILLVVAAYFYLLRYGWDYTELIFYTWLLGYSYYLLTTNFGINTVILAILIVTLGIIGIYYYSKIPGFWRKDKRMYDKLMHLGGWFALTVYLCLILNMFKVSNPIITASLGSFIFGVLYEIKDCFFADGFSVIDLLSDVVGIALATMLLFLL